MLSLETAVNISHKVMLFLRRSTGGIGEWTTLVEHLGKHGVNLCSFLLNLLLSLIVCLKSTCQFLIGLETE